MTMDIDDLDTYNDDPIHDIYVLLKTNRLRTFTSRGIHKFAHD